MKFKNKNHTHHTLKDRDFNNLNSSIFVLEQQKEHQRLAIAEER